MRRNNFLVTAVVALATFATLSAFMGHRYGYNRWRHHHCYNDRYERDQRPPRDTTTFIP